MLVMSIHPQNRLQAIYMWWQCQCP